MAGEEKKVSVGRTSHYEFGGPVGVLLMMLFMPAWILLLNLACTKDSCTVWVMPQIPTQLSDYWDWNVALIVLGWVVYQMALSVLPFGSVCEGLPLNTGHKLKYRCNGFLAFVLTMVTFGLLVYAGYPVTYVYDKYLHFVTAAVVLSVVLSIFLYIKACMAPNHALAGGGNSGNIIYDFFMGHELNPRLGPVDLKFFFELRPGLIGWTVLNLCLVVQSYQQLGYLSPAIALVTLFQAFYVADALWFEEAILTTMDIVHDGFGFMLAFGDIAWVPFLYGIQVRFLVDHPQEWSAVGLVAIVLFNLLGYMIFRGSNSQKNAFRKNPYDPALQYLESMATSSGKRLLVSGWWGLCRHPNYLGDLIMALAWCLPCGFGHIIPYYYPVYFLVLLIHRNSRDEANCRQKYGADWDKYCQQVKYRIFPFIY